MTKPMKTEVLGLAGAINELRRQLVKAQDEGNRERLRFRITEAEVEIGLEARREGNAGGKIDFVVASVDASGTAGKTATHVLRVKLEVRNRDGSLTEVSDDGGHDWD